MSVDLPAPFGPMHATRDESDTWTVAFSIVTLSLRGYLKDTSTTLMRALPFDFTPVPRMSRNRREMLSCAWRQRFRHIEVLKSR